MTWLRTIFVFCFIVLYIFAKLFFFLVKCCGFELLPAENERLARLPIVKDYLKTKARAFDYKKDMDVPTCSICLEDYNEQNKDKIAELNCNHIFHLDCLNEWIDKNDICPMCREPILK